MCLPNQLDRVYLLLRGQPLCVYRRVRQEDDENDEDGKGQHDTDDMQPLPRFEAADENTVRVVLDELVRHHGEENIGEAARRPP